MSGIELLQEHEEKLTKIYSSDIKLSRLKDAEIIKLMKERSRLAFPFPKPILIPSSVDYSPFICFVRNQGAWGCFANAQAACWDIQNERKFPYSPNISVNRILWAFTFEVIRKETIPFGNQTANTVDDYLKNFGSPTEGTELTNSDALQWPTTAGDLECPHFKLAVHSTPIQVTLEQLKISLAEKGPLRIGVWGNHFVALVGYDDATQKFKFINSWGDDWGDNGFWYIDYAKLNQEVDSAEFYDFSIQPMPTARIAFNSNHRQDVYMWLGVENQNKAKRIWPNGQRQDNSKNLNITVTLPDGFQWPPKQGNRLYLDVYASGITYSYGGQMIEFTAAFNGQIFKCTEIKTDNTFNVQKLKRFYIG
jgi:hypothetical protein